MFVFAVIDKKIKDGYFVKTFKQMYSYYEKLINIQRQLLQIWEHCREKN